MNIGGLVAGLTNQTLGLDAEIVIKGLALDSRKIELGFVFIAVAGAEQHGLKYAQQVQKKGAVAIIYDSLGSDDFCLEAIEIPLVVVDGLTAKLGLLADRFYQSPSKRLDVIGITGTNGKTSCSQFLQQLLTDSGVIGTLGWGGSQSLNKTLNTTPDALAMQQILAEFVSMGKKAVVMEVSSHGLEQGRVNAVDFKGAVFTNLSRDHLDYHGSMGEYLQAKLLLFKRPELRFVVVNADQDCSNKVLSVVNDTAKKWAFSINGKKCAGAESIVAKEIKIGLSGIQFWLYWQNKQVLVESAIVGEFNVENILTVITVLLAQGYSLEYAVESVTTLTPVCGRMECFGGNKKPTVIVDYAHTPDALEKVLLGLRKLSPQKLCLVFGCGGNRDKGKRQQMAVVAEQLTDHFVMTNDNPRFEDPQQIINDMVAGCKSNNHNVIENREQAIRAMIKQANKDDCIVIAGKGHEEYQDIKGVKHFFSDQAVVKQVLLEWA